jgi:hypothetical protein
VEDVEGNGDRPGEEEFAMATDVTAGGDTVGALLDPCQYVRTKVRPKEIEMDAMEGILSSHVTSGG